MQNKDKIRIKHALESIEEIESYFKEKPDKNEFENNKMLRGAIVRQLEVIGEALGAVDVETQERFSEIMWRDWRSLRNILIHQYFGIDYETVFITVTDELPVLKEQLINILEK